VRAQPPATADPVEAYWTRHTVNSKPFESAEESERYLEWRFEQYPLFREFMDLWGDHRGETVLDFGCGPGDDTVGLLLHSGAAKVVSVDISRTALDLLGHRLRLHGIDPERTQLVHSSNTSPEIPLDTASIDFVNTGGVLHHASDPLGILRELRRVLRPGGRAHIMVYHRDSVWWHLWTAYVRMVVQGDFAGLSIEEAFARNTDGEECPISRAYRGEEFLAMCREAGFEGRFLGGYLSQLELKVLADHLDDAVASSRLDAEHRDFLRALTFDDRGFPLHEGRHAGIGGVYRLETA
jgi:ubiquinone/menaquinone biosynthesis C-methylase UbiE